MNKKKIWKGIKITILVIMLLTIALAIVVGVILGTKFYPVYIEARQIAYSRMSLLEEENFKKPEDTKIFSPDNKLLREINTGNYVYVDYDKTSHYLIDGYVAVEDKRFFEHNGIDKKALLRASKVLLKNKGEIKQGGSTITQQVLKNNVLFDVKERYVRKFAEFILAPTLETKYSKEKIMEFYLNTNFYGNNSYGIGAASRFYFNKDAKDLELHEAALLVGLSNSPSKLNPLKYEQEALEKRNFVLRRMFEEGFIPESVLNEYSKKDLELNVYRELNKKDDYISSYAIHSTVLALMEKDGFEFKYQFNGKAEQDEYKENYISVYSTLADRVRRGGYKINTTIEPDIQTKAQEILDSILVKEQERTEDGRFALQASVAVVRNSDQRIIALVGGRGTEDEFNRGYQGYRQPGSSIKPLLVYGPAFETGRYYPSKMLVDKKINEKDAPQNYGNAYYGEVSLREAVGRSINTIPYKIIQELGVSNSLKYLAKLKFKGLSSQDNNNAVMALGGFTYGTTVEEMARGYSTIVNKGSYPRLFGVSEVIDTKTGESAIDGLSAIREKVYTEDTVYLLWDVLKAPLDEYYGTAQRNKIKNQILIGKTGTTNEEKDVWFIGLNDLYTIAVWVGYDTPRPMKDSFNKNYTGRIFKGIMEYLLEGKQTKEIAKPQNIFEAYVDSDGDPTDNSTGEKAYFSKALLRKADEETRQAMLEKERQKREERERLDAELTLEVDSLVVQLRNKLNSLDVIRTAEQYTEVITAEQEIKSKIRKIGDDSRRENLNNQLTNLLRPFYERDDVQRILAFEKQRMVEAEKARLEQLNLLEITKAQTKVMRLSEFNGNYSAMDEEYEKALKQALKEANDAVYSLNNNNTADVELLRKRFNDERQRLEVILAEKEAERIEYNKQIFEKQREEQENSNESDPSTNNPIVDPNGNTLQEPPETVNEDVVL